MATLAEQMLAKKEAELAAQKAAEEAEGKEIIEEGEGEGEGEGEIEPPKEDPTLAETKAQEVSDIAMQAGTTEVPRLDDPEKTSGVAILTQTDHPTEAEVQTRRTQVSTNVIIQPSDPIGANPADPNPPNGTLPNSGMVYTESPDTPMGSLHDALQKGVALNKVSDEENEKALKLMEGQLRAQRMAEGRPQDIDLAAQSEEEGAPDGAEYKSNGITRFVDKSGNWLNAVNGYFIPRNDDDRAILDHFVKQNVVNKI